MIAENFLKDKFWNNKSSYLPKDSQEVWFVVKDNIYAGYFWEEGNIFGMADGKGFPADQVTHWMPSDVNREFTKYPKQGERVAIEVKSLPCLATGTFDMSYFDIDSCKELPALILDSIYSFDTDPWDLAVDWKDVFSWIPCPQLPTAAAIGIAKPFEKEENSKENNEVDAPQKNLKKSASAIVNSTLNEKKDSFIDQNLIQNILKKKDNLSQDLFSLSKMCPELKELSIELIDALDNLQKVIKKHL